MQIKQILTVESRYLNNLNTIIFEKDTNGWYTCYEWSAYLINKYNKTADKLSIIKKYHKSENIEIIKSSMQLKSFDKFIKFAYKDNLVFDNDFIYITIPFDIEESIDNYKLILVDFKQSIPLKEGRMVLKKSDLSIQPSLMSIAQKIMSYLLENKTLIENCQFISDLKKDLNQILKN